MWAQVRGSLPRQRHDQTGGNLQARWSVGGEGSQSLGPGNRLPAMRSASPCDLSGRPRYFRLALPRLETCSLWKILWASSALWQPHLLQRLPQSSKRPRRHRGGQQLQEVRARVSGEEKSCLSSPLSTALPSAPLCSLHPCYQAEVPLWTGKPTSQVW